MSFLAEFLRPIVNRCGTTHDFALAAGLSQSTVWRLLNDRTIPDDSILAKLVQYLGEDDGSKIVEAFLRDRLSSDLRGLVKIQANPSRIKEDEPLESVFQQLNPTVRQAFVRLANSCIDDREVADLMVSLSKRLG